MSIIIILKLKKKLYSESLYVNQLQLKFNCYWTPAFNLLKLHLDIIN